MRTQLVAVLTALLLIPAVAGAEAPALDVPISLRGSRASMERQNQVAKHYDLVFAVTPADVARMERDGALIRMQGNDDYELASHVRWPVARRETRLFIERLAAAYRAATGEKLVVTSLTRPVTRQPPNAHELSVHPAGVAIDLRVPRRSATRHWIEKTLLALEEQGLLDVTREYHPPHYHVALFPDAYMDHVEGIVAQYATPLPDVAPAPRDGRPALQRATTMVDPSTGLLAAMFALPLMILIPTYRRRTRER